MKKRYPVRLTPSEREYLRQLIASGTETARKLIHARVLLKADQSEGGPSLVDEAIAAAVEVSQPTVSRVRKQYVEEGLEAALNRRGPRREYHRKLDGEQEAHLVAVACGPLPEGQARWSLRLLADKLVELEVVESLSYQTVRRVLKKNQLKPHLRKQWVIPPEHSGEFVWRMEEVLEVYKRPYDERYPLVCMDETSKQLLRDSRKSIPAKLGRVERVDYEYEREGVVNLFLFCEPLAAKRWVDVTDHRTKSDWEGQIKELLDVRYPEAERIVLVADNLNVHTPGALYEVFPPEEARRLVERLEIHHTPKHGSWLNIAEIELSVLGRQCLSRRVPDFETLEAEVRAWQDSRNGAGGKVNWQFTAGDARIKLKRLYPSIEE